jgi:Tol biopolymer transport system component
MTTRTLISTVLLLASLAMGQAREPEAALGAAIHLEEAKGDYAGAIAAYKKFLAQYGSNQALAAKAQLRLGVCYEKLGDAEARRAYEQVIARYSGQKEIVEQARARLAALLPAGARAGSFTARRILDSGVWITGHVSRDGRWLPWGDSKGNLLIRDMRTGDLKPITNETGTWVRFIENAAISPDHRKLAYSFWDQDGTDVYLSNLDGTGRQMIWKRDSPKAVAVVSGWLADNRNLAILIMSGASSRLGVIDTGNGGGIRLLPELRSGYAFNCGGISHDGRFASMLTRKSPSAGSPQPSSIVIYDLQKESEIPLALPPGEYHTPVFSPDGAELYFVSNRRGQYDLYAIGLTEGRPSGNERVVKAGIGNASLGGFSGAGVLHYSENTRITDIFTSTLLAVDGTKFGKPERMPLKYAGAARYPRYSPDGKKLFYAHALDGQAWKLIIRDLATGVEREFLTEFGLLGAEWTVDSRQMIVGASTNPASGSAALVMFRFDTQSGAREPLKLPAEFGDSRVFRLLPTADPDVMILSLRRDGGDAAKVVRLNLRTNQSTVLFTPGGGAFAAVAALSPDGKWLIVSTNGEAGNFKSLQLVPVGGGPARQLARQQAGWFGHAAWLPDSSGFVIAAGLGGSENAFWKFSIQEGAAPLRVIDFRSTASILSLHPDGKTLAFSAGWGQHDLWVATNVLPAKQR